MVEIFCRVISPENVFLPPFTLNVMLSNDFSDKVKASPIGKGDIQ